MSRNHHERYTGRNQTKPGLTLTYTNLRGERPYTARRDRRVAQLREILERDPMTVADVAEMFKVKPATAERYLELARAVAQ